MNNDIRLYIQNTKGQFENIDLYEDENISIVDSIQDVKDIKKIFNVFSRDFKVRASYENNKKFKHYYNLNIDNGFDGRKKTKALMTIGGNDYRVGYLRLIDVILKDNKVDSYKLSFQGETVSLKDIIKDDKLKDLDFTEIVFDNTPEKRVEGIRDGLYSGGNVSFDDDGNQLYPDVIFVPIFSGGKVVAHPHGEDYSNTASLKPTDNSYDFSLVKFTGQGGGKTSSATSGVDASFLGLSATFTNFPISPYDFKTGVKVGRLLQMVDDKYPELILENSFIQREELDQMYMLFNGEIETGATQNVSDAFNNSTSALPDGQVNSVVYTTEAGDPNGAITLVRDTGADFHYIVMDTNSSRPRLSEGIFVCEDNRATEKVDVTIKKYYYNSSGRRVNLLVTTINDIQSGATYPRNGLNLSTWGNGSAANGRNMYMDVTFTCSQQLDGLIDFRFDYAAWNGSSLVKAKSVSTQPISSFIIDIKNYAPEIKVLDLVMGIFKMFNMTAYVENDAVVIKELEDYYKEGVSHDITTLVEANKSSVSPGFNYKSVSMRHKEAEDVLTKNFLGSTNFGDMDISKADFIEDVQENEEYLLDGKEYKIETPFSRMMLENLYLGFDSAQQLLGTYANGSGGLPTDIVIGNQIDGTLKEVKTKPILFFAKQADTSRTFQETSGSNDILDLAGYQAGLFTENGNSAGIHGNLAGGRGLVLTETVSEASINDYGLSTIGVFKASDGTTEIGANDKNRWFNPSSIMPTRFKRNGELINPFGKFQSLNFNNDIYDEFEYHNGANADVFINGLYQTNYERYINNVYSKDARITKFDVNFTQALINQYSLKDTFIVGSNQYNINKINLNLLTGKGKVELINKIEFEEVDPAETTGSLARKSITGLNLLPSSGNYIYNLSPILAYSETIGTNETININNEDGFADAYYAFTKMREEYPNLESLGIITTWYGDTDDDTMSIQPRLDVATGFTSFSDDWSVGTYDRTNTLTTTINSLGKSNVGGTPDDSGLVEFVNLCNNEGIKVMLYPFLQMDTEGKEWRGQIQFDGTQAGLDNWFDTYTDFIRHYSQLFGGTNKIDKFMIGSEFVTLTQLIINGEYEGVNKLVTLASQVKGDFGSDSAKISYGANWDEYHSHNGVYHMDKLWTSNDIDEVSIDNYFPLTDFQDPSTVTYQDIVDGFESGEGWEHYYSTYNDPSSKVDYDVAGGEFAWKNIFGWWDRDHTGATTNLLTNGDMSSVSWPWNHGSWSYITPTTDGSTATLTLTGTYPTDFPRIEQTFATTIGEDYDVTINIDSNGNPCKLIVVEDGTFTFIDSTSSITTSGYEDVSFTFTATSTNTILQILIEGTSGDEAFVTNAEVIEVGGAPASGWTARMKPLFFAEYGFASVDGTTNQPNIFAPLLPRESTGTTDFEVMKQSLIAFNAYWDAKTQGVSGFAEDRFAWAYDIRPYPAFPHYNIWDDSDKWSQGHWLNGKLI